MGEKLRCAVIGVGAIGLDHLAHLSHHPRATIVAISDNHRQRLKEATDKFKVPRSYLDYQELLEQPDVDAVVVATPNYLHAPMALDALRARKHVLLEKPMALNAKEGAKIVAAAQQMKRTLMVAHNLRFNRHTQVARHFIQRGELGEVYHVHASWCRRAGIPRIGSWFTQKKYSGGGCACDLGVHMIDLACHLLGEFDAVAVSAQTQARFGSRGLGEFDWGKSEVDPRRPFDVEDHASAHIRLKSGRIITLDVTWAGYHSPDKPEQSLELLGAAGGLSLFPARFFRPGPNGYEATLLSTPKATLPEDRVSHFVTCALEGKKPLVAPEESLAVQRILDALYTSAATGQEVVLKI